MDSIHKCALILSVTNDKGKTDKYLITAHVHDQAKYKIRRFPTDRFFEMSNCYQKFVVEVSFTTSEVATLHLLLYNILHSIFHYLYLYYLHLVLLFLKLTKKTRSSRSQMFFKIGVLKNFANFIGKHLR